MLVAEVDDLHDISHTVSPKPAALTGIAPTPTITLGHVGFFAIVYPSWIASLIE